MAQEVEWGETGGQTGLPALNQEEKDDLLSKIKAFGQVDQPTVEAMLVGHLVYNRDVEEFAPELCAGGNADKMSDAGITGKMFENKALGALFDELMGYYRVSRRLMSIEEGAQSALLSGDKPDSALMYSDVMDKCSAAAATRPITVSFLIERMKAHYYTRTAEKIYKQFVHERGQIGPMKALDNFRNAVRTSLIDPDGEPLKEYDLGMDASASVDWLLDMKRNPHKHRGAMCGIPVIDSGTSGFLPGQLTVFVGKNGGYKTTTMINVAYGLWERGYDVLYASLEMEARLMEAKLLCRHTRKLRWSKMFKGLISEPEDWQRLEELRAATVDEALTEDERNLAMERLLTIQATLDGVTQGQEEILLARQASDEIRSRKNRLKIVNVGQSKKIKIGQLEAWLEERHEEWQPQVIIVDYLALVDSDNTYGDRRDLEVGEVTKRFRQMGARLGFSTISAAQYKRECLARVKKVGIGNIERVAFGPEDIAESSYIGNDADNIFFLWPEEGSRVRVFKIKTRHNDPGKSQGETLEVDADHCWISEDIQSTMEVSETIPLDVALESANRIASGDMLAAPIPDEPDDLDMALADAEPLDETGTDPYAMFEGDGNDAV